MEMLGANSLDMMRKVELKLRQQKKVYGLPMPLIVSFARKLVSTDHNILTPTNSDCKLKILPCFGLSTL